MRVDMTGLNLDVDIQINTDFSRDMLMITDTLVESEYMRSVDRCVDDMADAMAYAILARRRGG